MKMDEARSFDTMVYIDMYIHINYIIKLL